MARRTVLTYLDSRYVSSSRITLSGDGREYVDEMISKAIDAGDRESRQPQNLGWMCGGSFKEINGHLVK